MPKPRRNPDSTTIRVTLFVSPQSMIHLAERANAYGGSMGAVVDELVRAQTPRRREGDRIIRTVTERLGPSAPITFSPAKPLHHEWGGPHPTFGRRCKFCGVLKTALNERQDCPGEQK